MEHVTSAVGFTAKLKPEIRLARAISEFNASLQNKNQRARFKNLRSQSLPDPDDIIRITEEINRDGARAHRSWRPYGTRLVAILERMRQFAPIGDVLVGGSQNLIACGVWAVIRLSLEVGVFFKPMESDLTAWGMLIEKRTTLLLGKAELQNHSSVLDLFNRFQITLSAETTKFQTEARKQRLLAAMCPDQAEFNLIWRRERKRGTSSWMYEEDAYRDWLSSKAGFVLWLKGNLGSGKTVTMASAVAHLTLAAPSMNPQGAVTVSYFFCQSNNPKTLCATNLLGSIVRQVLQSPAIEPSVIALLEQSQAIPLRATPEECIDILIKVTPSNWRGIFVLDGLDEISEEVFDETFRELHRLQSHRWISILCSSRPTSACYSTVESRFDEVRTLSMETADRSKEIHAYLAAEISRWNAIRPLPPEIEKLMEEQLFVGCQGMFLWLSLQIEDICPRYTQELRSEAEILDILGNLPKDLPGAFNKALSRVRDGKRSSQLFKLVASAEPPMKTDELRVAANVNPGNTAWESSTLVGTGRALISAYGGSLLDIDEEDLRVRFIHYSVLLHLTGPSSDRKTRIFHFDLSEAEMMLGAVCVTYLSYSVFENRISRAQKASFAEVPEVTARSVMPSETFRKGINLLLRYRRQRDPKVDLERISHEMQKQRTKVHDDVHLFLDYAKDQWLLSTRQIWLDNQSGVLSLWRDLITSPIVSDSLPWDTVAQAATWALENNHGTLFQHYLHSKERDNLSVVLTAATNTVRSGISQIRLKRGGLGWLAPLYLMFPEYQASIMQVFVKLGCLPHNPDLERPPHPNFYGDSLVTNVISHLVACLKTYSKDPEIDAYVLFLANYLPCPNLIFENESLTLHLAIERGFTPITYQLLQKGATPENAIFNKVGEGSPPLFLAIAEENWELFKTLLRQGKYSIDGMFGPEYETTLRSRRSGPKSLFSEAALTALIKQGANTQLKDSGGETPLLLAVRSGEQRLANLLLEQGADPSVGNDLGAQPLHFARDEVTIQQLLLHGADPEAAIRGLVTPLMLAAYQGRAKAVRALLDNGANPHPSVAGVSSRQALLLGWRNTGKAHSRAITIELCMQRPERELENRPGASRERQSETAQLSSEMDAFRRLMDSLSNCDNDADFVPDFESVWKSLTNATGFIAGVDIPKEAAINT
ncbi:hypothetical protein NW752_003332 [Fusarium irregulare]|uniref:Nephrocystin 3-like N-terminal domain-containing protein n=1 Tax=Fusarium irregulare TaxID=2494466 RepID=A0A9W8UBZ4_9HYPO|nr:hypothetical protein NW766_004400 [Fusarium irregulare]KAJ4022877.1 hypothetical protein NW752_003332 [Fusarium irregulare]